MFVQFKKYPLNIKEHEGKKLVFDIIRKKYVALTPEEWIRQHWLWYFTEDKKFPKPLLFVEHAIEVNGMNRRCDVTVFNRNTKPALILECKSFDVELSQKTLEQVAQYNMELRVPFVIISNGITTHGCKINFEKNDFELIERIPDYSELEF